MIVLSVSPPIRGAKLAAAFHPMRGERSRLSAALSPDSGCRDHGLFYQGDKLRFLSFIGNLKGQGGASVV